MKKLYIYRKKNTHTQKSNTTSLDKLAGAGKAFPFWYFCEEICGKPII